MILTPAQANASKQLPEGMDAANRYMARQTAEINTLIKQKIITIDLLRIDLDTATKEA